MALFGGAAAAPAQLEAPLALDPSVPRQGTTLLVAADQSLLSPNGQPAQAITFALGRGMRVDTRSVEQLCPRRDAARSACPPASRIGFGRFNLEVQGYAPGGGQTELGWAIDAYLGEPKRRGDAASVVLVGKLLGADLVGALLAPEIGTSVPSTTLTSGRLVRRKSGTYAIELQFDSLPTELDLKPPMSATPARLELTLGAVRRVRQNFIRRFKVKTPSGYEVRRIHDHRLIGHYLLRTPESCNGSWPSEVRVAVAGRVKRTARRIACTNAVGTAARTD